MNKFFLYSVIFALLFFQVSACSKDKDDEKEKGAIEKMTEKTAQDIVNKIQTPIDRAKDAKETEEDRAKKMDEMLKEQK